MSDLEDLEKVIIHLLSNQGVFYASLLSQMRRTINNKLPAPAGVTVRNGRIELYWNANMMREFTLDEKVAIMVHECLHLIMDHLTRIQSRDHKLWNVACVPGDTLILGANKKIKNITTGDLVLQDGNVGEVSSVIKKQYKGDLFTITPSSLLKADFTEEHPILIKRKRYNNHYLLSQQWVCAKDVQVGDYVVVPKLKTQQYSVLDLSDFVNKDLTNNHSQSRNVCKKLRSEKISLTNELAWVLGFYVADGSLNSGINYGINFALSPNKDKENLLSLQTFFRTLGYKVNTIKSVKRYSPPFYNTDVVLKCNSSILGKAFSSWCGRGAKNKRIPDFILFNSDKKIVKAFLDGYFAGDGCEYKKSQLAGTVSPTLARQLQLAIINLGENNWSHLKQVKNNGLGKLPMYIVTWGKPAKTTRSFKKVISSHSYRWKEFSDHFAVPVLEIKKQKYRGLVYNLETQDHTFVVNNFLTHNCDLAINQMINNLPKGVITLKSFPSDWKLPSKSIAEVYYDKIKENSPRMKITEMKGSKCPTCGGTGKDPNSQNKSDKEKDQTQDKKGGQGNKSENKDSEKGQQQNGNDGNKDGKDSQAPGSCPDCGGSGGEKSKYKVEVFDKNGKKTNEFELDNPGTHEDWEKSDSPDIAREVVRQSVEQAKEVTQRQQGTVPGDIAEYIEELLKPPVIPWWVLLKRFIAAKIKSGFKRSWKRPNRRFGEVQKGKLPSRKLKIINVIDTSGSIGTDDFQDFIGEIQGIQRIYKAKMTNIECDWDIQKTYDMSPTDRLDTKFKGRGGTSFKPPFKYIEENHLNPDLVIYFTDMYGDFPDKKPPYPVLWVTVSDVDKAPFGTVLSIPKHKPKK